MAGGRRDAEADLRDRLASSARSYVALVHQRKTTPGAAVRLLAEDAFGDPARLQDAVELLDEHQDAEARALLVRATRYADGPAGAWPPRPVPPDPWLAPN